jgi:hypothetical protein
MWLERRTILRGDVVRTKERTAALLALYVEYPGIAFIQAIDPVTMMEPPSRISGSEFLCPEP